MHFMTSLPLLHTYVPGSSFVWQPHYVIYASLFFLEGAYLFALSWLHDRAPEQRPLSSNQVLLFSLGVVAMFLAVASPLDDLSDYYLVSAHMLQHLILAMVVPPLLLLGLPGWLLRPLVCRRSILPFAQILTQPLVAFTLFNLAILFVHLPNAISLELQHEYLVHFPAHVILLFTGMLMWWPVLSPMPELPRLSYPMQIVFLFVQSFVPAVLAAFLVFSTSAIYPVYESAPRLWNISPIVDQQIGGIIMKLGGTAILWTVMTVIFYRWYQQEQQKEPTPAAPPSPLTWKDVEEELVRMGVTKRGADDA